MAAMGSMCTRRMLQTIGKWTISTSGTGTVHISCQNGLWVRPWSSFHHALRTVHKHGVMCDGINVCFAGPLACHQHTSQGRLLATDASQTGKTPGVNITEDILKARVSAEAVSEQKDGGKGEGDGQEKKKKDSWFSGKHAWKLGLLSMSGMGFLMCGNLLVLWGAPLRDKEGNELRDEFTEFPTWKAYPKRAWKEFHFFKKMIQEPSSEKLLPEPVKEPYYQPPYTLVLEMTDVLVHPDWTLGTGWRFKKRPGIDYFLQQVAPPLFEIVIYTREQGFTAFPIIDGLDPNGYISFRLFRDATRYMNGHHVKDLGCLNRDSSKIIIVDCDSKAYQLHPRNAIGLQKWTGDDEDRTLIDLAGFLRTIAVSGVEDVRVVLDYYHQYDDPIAVFKENQRKLQEEQDRIAAETIDKSNQASLAGKWSVGLFGRRKGT